MILENAAQVISKRIVEGHQIRRCSTARTVSLPVPRPDQITTERAEVANERRKRELKGVPADGRNSCRTSRMSRSRGCKARRRAHAIPTPDRGRDRVRILQAFGCYPELSNAFASRDARSPLSIAPSM